MCCAAGAGYVVCATYAGVVQVFDATCRKNVFDIETGRSVCQMLVKGNSLYVADQESVFAYELKSNIFSPHWTTESRGRLIGFASDSLMSINERLELVPIRLKCITYK